MKGRHPSAIDLRAGSNVVKLKSDASDTRLPEQASRFAIAIPPMPEVVAEDPDAAAMWQSVTQAMLAAGMITPLFTGAVAGYCIAWGRVCQAERKMRELRAEAEAKGAAGNTGWIIFTPQGFPVQGPYLQIANKALEQLRAYAGELGLTPTALSRAAGNAQMSLPFGGEDEFEKFLRNGKPA